MEIVKLGDICRPKQWKTIPMSKLKEEGYSVYGANGVIGYYDEYTHENPTVLITCRGATCGTINISEPKSYINGNAMALDNLSSDCDLYYLAYYLKERGFHDVISGSAQPQITREGLKKVEIPLPSLSVQQAIAAQLDQARELVQYHHQLLEKYDELQQSLFLEMFGDPVLNEKGWEKKKGNDIFEVFGGGTFKSKDYSESGIPLIRIGTVNKGFFDESELVFLPNDFLKSHSRFLLKSGDLLMTLTGTVGKDDYGNTYILDNKYEHYFLNQRVAKIEVNPEYLNKLFLTYVFRQPRIKGELTNINRGVRQANISNRDLHSLNIILPPLSLQNEFASYIESIEYQKSLVREALQQSEDVFNGLLQESFG